MTDHMMLFVFALSNSWRGAMSSSMVEGGSAAGVEIFAERRF